MKIDVINAVSTVRWIKHPQPECMDQVVSLLGQNGTCKMLAVLSIPVFRAAGDPQLLQDLDPELLECDHWDWLTGAQHQGDDYLIQSWTSESMNKNQESGINENMTTKGMFNAVLTRNADSNFFLKDYGIWTSPGGIAPFISQSVTQVAYLNDQGSVCQIGFNMNVASAAQVLRQEEFNRVAPKTRKQIRGATAKDYFEQINRDINSLIRIPKNESEQVRAE